MQPGKNKIMPQALIHLIQQLKKVYCFDIAKLVNVPTSLSNFKTKEDDLDVGKLKTVPVALKKLSHVVNNEVVKKTKINTLKTKVRNLEKKVSHATTLIHINQHKTDIQNLERKKQRY